MRRSVLAAIAGATLLSGSCWASPRRTNRKRIRRRWRPLHEFVSRRPTVIGPGTACALDGPDRPPSIRVPGHAAAIAQVAAVMRALGARVTLQPAKVPHWVRGEERAELTRFPGRRDGLSQHLHLTALGGSSATPAAGIEAPVIVVRDFDDLKAHAAEVRGKIVLFDSRFDQRLADNGHAGAAYQQAGDYRFRGPSEAAA